MEKRGQTTIFIILAIVVVIAIVLGSYTVMQNKKTSEDREFFESLQNKPTIEKIQLEVQDCLEETSKDALDKIGVQGGFYKKPLSSSDYFDLEWAFVPYYYNQGKYSMPLTSKIETELSFYVEDKINNCLGETEYPEFDVSYRNPDVKTTISNKEVMFEIDHPVKIEKDEHTLIYQTEEHPVKIPSALKEILEIANFITESHKDDPAMYCISCVGEMAEERDVYVDIINFRENEMLVIISENRTSSEPYSFEFLNKYTGEEISPETEVGTETTGTVPSPPAA